MYAHVITVVSPHLIFISPSVLRFKVLDSQILKHMVLEPLSWVYLVRETSLVIHL